MTEKKNRNKKQSKAKTSSKVSKGNFGYFRSEKRRRLIITAILFAVPLFIFFTSWFYFKTSTFKTSKYKDLRVMKRKEKYRLEQKSAEILQKRLSTENENFFNLVKSLEILDYVEIISVRQENRSTDFLEEKWLNF